MKNVTIINTEIDNVTFDEAVSTIIEWVKDNHSPRYVVTPNVDHIIRLQYDKKFQIIYRKADLILADGMPLLWAAKFLGTPLCEKISGSDLFVKICKVATKKKFKLFFLGGNPGDVEKAKEVLVQQNPGLLVAGVYCPSFGFENDEAERKRIVERIEATEPDILFVGLGAPKQEKWIYENYHEIGVPVNIGIGVSFSFVAGTLKRAPVCIQKIGFEWLWRLIMEPGRLWKRYLVDDMKFFRLVLKQKFSPGGYSRRM
jgi:N-acetylglucosaminyldiphosphoundecaprenol N-acetyl-beta-D-mannosaminyltransferase